MAATQADAVIKPIWSFLTCVAQTSSNAVDGNMNAALCAFVTVLRAFACSETTDQLHLQMVQGVDVGKPMANGSRQCGIVHQPLFVARDVFECI